VYLVEVMKIPRGQYASSKRALELLDSVGVRCVNYKPWEFTFKKRLNLLGTLVVHHPKNLGEKSNLLTTTMSNNILIKII
jgi:hypothetical protein